MVTRDYKVLIADDHAIFRLGVRSFLENKPFQIKEVSSVEKLWEVLCESKNMPDLMILDYFLPDGTARDVLSQMKRKGIKLPTIVLTSLNDKNRIADLVLYNIEGIVLKDSGIEELTLAINSVLTGKHYFDAHLMSIISENQGERPRQKQDEDTWVASISKRELAVLKLITKGYSNKQIADELFISYRTVEKHRSNILRKANSRNFYQVLMTLRGKGLIEFQ